MKKLISIFTAILLFCCITSINAQDLLRVDEIEIVNSQPSNVMVQIKTIELGQTVLNRVNQTNVNDKEGFEVQFNAENTFISLNFTKKFNADELKTLLIYSGLELKEADFNQLYNLINQ